MTPNRNDLDAWVCAFEALMTHPPTDWARHPMGWALERLMPPVTLAHAQQTWAGIHALLTRPQPPHPAGVSYAMGEPIEWLLTDWGPHVIDEIEAAAQAHPRVRAALAGIAPAGDPEVWARLLALRTAP